jgi:O-antigen ligase
LGGSIEKFESKLKVYDTFDDTTPSRRSTALFILVCILPIAATLLFGGVDTISLGLLSLATAVMFCIWISDAWRNAEFRFSSNLLQAPIAVLIFLGVIQMLPLGDPGLPSGTLEVAASNALTLDPFATRLFVVRTIAYLIFFAAALTFVDSEKRATRLATLTIIFGSVIAFFGILQRLADPEAIYGLRPTPQAIPFGPFINQHHFAAFMEMTSGLVLAMLLGGGMKRDRKLFLLIAAVLMTLSTLFTGSRGGVISFAALTAFVVAAHYFLDRGKRSRRKEAKSGTRNFALLAGAVAFIFLIFGLALFLGGGESLLRGVGMQSAQADFSSGRVSYWQTAFEIFKAHPILGAGLDAFANAFTRYDTLPGAFRVEQAHNDYLQILADGGIVGLACVLAFLVILFRNGLRNIASMSDDFGRSIAIGALAGCFGIAIHSFFDFPLRTPSNALFFLLLSVLATTRFAARTD